MAGSRMTTKGPIALARRQARYLGMALWMPYILWGATVVGKIFGNAKKVDVDWKRKWSRGAVKIVGLDVHVVSGTPSWESERGRIIISNHRTPLDIMALLYLFGGHFLANHRVERAPIIGAGARRIGTVFVDRDDRKSGVGAIRALRRLLEEKKTVIVFPEGTTFGGDEVRPFKGGAFTAGNGLDVDIVPVGFAYTPGHEFADGKTGAHVRSFLSRPRTPSWVSIGDPIPFPTARKGLEESMREKVQELVLRSRRAADAALSKSAPPALRAGDDRPETPGETA